ncbi:MAG: STAS domain-containing protein [Prochlorotrichaceae cyanobacterium]
MTSSPFLQVLYPKNVLDADQGKVLYRQVMDLLDAGVSLILLDCQDLEFVDSSGLGVLVRILKVVEQDESRLALCSLSESFQMLLKMTRMEDVFEIYASQVHFNLVLEQSLKS